MSGVTIKTRKRNIVVPVDPNSFANAVVAIVQDASEGLTNTEEIVEAATKAIDNANLEFNRYGDTLFEVLFAGGILAAGGKLADESAPKFATNVMATASEREALTPFVKMFATLARRRPFLIRGLENTMIKLLLSAEFFDDSNRRKLGIVLALIFSQKINVVPENILTSLLNDRLVVKGTVQEVLTIFFQEFLAKDNIDDLVSILSRAKVVDRLLEFFPPQHRTAEAFNKHFTEAGLLVLVEWNHKRTLELRTTELMDAVTEQINADPPVAPNDTLNMVKAKKAEHDLPDAEVLRVIWTALMKSINMTGKNQQQILQAIVAKIKLYHKLLSTYATNGKLELQLLVIVQVHCYEDNRLLKIFSDIMKLLYDADIVQEDTILHWYKKGSHPKGRNVFLKDAESFIKWLEEAEEDEEADD